MEIEQVVDNNIEIVYPIARIDTVTSKEFEKYMIDVIARAQKIIISFSKITSTFLKLDIFSFIYGIKIVNK